MGQSIPAGIPAIQTEGLTKYYGPHRGIEDLDLSVREGEIFGFLGPNGAGKTTTIRLLMDLIRPTRGRAVVFGKDSRADSVEIKRMVGYLPGEFALWNNLTGWQTLHYLGNLRGGVPPERIRETAERLQLDLGRKMREYSKGNKQKVGLVQAFMHRPRLLVLDEPTASLDPLNQQEFFRMAEEARGWGATIFLSSHIMSEVEHVCDRVGIVREGHLVSVGSVSEVIAERHFHVEIKLDEPAPAALDEFAHLPEVSDVEVLDSTLRFVVHGTIDSVVKHAANHRVLSLTSHEPTLEEAFLEYYRHEGEEAAAEEPAEPALTGR
ncbi:MAG TPA: ABC transporter ATP-binding protein [Chloroflexia bacterium]|nr:ABC transporter ATP-binding protein [Chloroflexia bacterium]